MIDKHPIQPPNAFWFDQMSSHTGRTYRIFISAPTGDAPDGGHKVIYALDGNASFLTFSEMLRLQTRPPHGFDPAIMVSIGFPTSEPFDTPRRYLDYTSPADIADLPQRPDLNWGENGGADGFLDFLEFELKPLIAAEFKTAPHTDALFGHSLGGFFTLYALTKRPHLFEAFSAASASIWWNKGELHTLMHGELPAKLSPLPQKPRLMMSIGGDELEDMRTDTDRLFQDLQETVGAQMSLTRFVAPGEDHISVLPAIISRTIAFALSPTGRKPHKVMSPGRVALEALKENRGAKDKA